MPNFREIEKNVIAAMLTIAWASTKKRDVSETEVFSMYKDFGGSTKF